MLATLIPLFDEKMAVKAYSLFTQKANHLTNPMLSGTGLNDGAGHIVGLEIINAMGIETLAKELGADDVWTLEHAGANSLAAEFPGRENRITRYAYLSASLDDPEACAAVLNTLKAFKDMRIKPKGTMHALFYSTARDSAGVNGLGAIFREDVQAGDQITFDMELSTRDTLPDRTFIIEDKAFFADQLIEVVPPYLEPLGSFDFKKGRYPNRHWQVSAPTYRYSFDPAALRKESAAITTFALLLN